MSKKPAIIEVSKHAKERAKERLSWSGHTIEKMAVRAWFAGSDIDELKGKLKPFVEIKARDYVARYYRVYGEYLYIYGYSLGTATLVTVFVIPSEYRRLLPKVKDEV